MLEMKLHTRKVLQDSYNDMSFQPINALHNSHSTSPPPQHLPSHHNQYSNPPFESCMALIVLVLLIALFFMGFFSIYIRRFSNEPAPEFSSPRRSPQSRPSRAVYGLRSQGLDPEVIKSLPVYGYYHGEAKYQVECAICLGEFEEGEIVKMIPYCKHVFHLECIETWLEMHVTCPVCRGTEFFEVDGGGGPPYRVDEGVSAQSGTSTVENNNACIEVGMGSGVALVAVQVQGREG